MKEKFNTDWAVFTVMDAKTGAIVASATNPNLTQMIQIQLKNI